MEAARKMREFVSRPIKLTGWVLLILGIIRFVPDWKARWDFWVNTFQSNDPLSRMIVSILTSPYLGLGLIVIGLAYLYFFRGVVHVHHGELTGSARSNASLTTEVHRSNLWPIRDLFQHIHPLPFKSDAERDAVGKDVIDQIASDQVASWGRRIEGSKRGALEPIPFNNWRHAKFTYWFLDKDSEQSLHADCPTGPERGSPSRQYADIRVNREQAEKVWSYIPLKDAARIAYERTRESMSAKVAEGFGKTPEGILHYFASTIFLYHPVYAQKPPSTLRELVPMQLRSSMRVFADCDGIGYISDKQPTYIGALVTGADLEAFIQWAQETTFQAEPG